MATRSVLPLVVAALVVVAAAFPAGTDATWAAVSNPRELVITQVGRFCVIIYNLPHHTSFEFLRVVRGQTERLSTGTNYRLVLEVAPTHGTRPRLYQCEAWGVPGSLSNTWQLKSFTPIAA